MTHPEETRIPGPEEALPGRREPAYAIENRHAVLGTPLKPPFPEGIEVIYFVLGCYWTGEQVFWPVDGVYTTAVGFMNGTTPNPTDVEVESGKTGHAETVLVAFDPTVISFAELLKVFLEEHDPTQGMRQGEEVGTHARSGIYFTRRPSGRAPSLRWRLTARRYALPGTTRSPPRSMPPAPSITAATRTSSTCTRIRTPSTAPWSAPGSPAGSRAPPAEHGCRLGSARTLCDLTA
jgi:peptide-methionine (S)-S-oxide reductase